MGDVLIKSLRLQQLRFEVTKELNSGEGFVQVSIRHTAIKPPTSVDSVFIFINYNLSVDEKDDAKLVIEIVDPYELSPIKNIDASHIYQCTLLAQKHVQQLVNTALKNQTNRPTVGIVPYDDEDLLSELNNIVASLKDSLS